MINKNMVNTSGVDLLRGRASGDDPSQYFVPLFKVKLDPVAENDFTIEAEFTVRWFSVAENYFNKYLAKFIITANTPSLIFYKKDPSEGVGIKLCFIKVDEYYILYAKAGNQHFNINAQINYCNYPEDISICIEEENIAVASIDQYVPTYPSEISTIEITPSTNFTIARNDFQQHYDLLKDGTCLINATLYKNATITANDEICTISHHPVGHKIPVMLFCRELSNGANVEVCSGEIGTNGKLTILNAPANITGKTYVNFQIIYDSVNNSI